MKKNIIKKSINSLLIILMLLIVALTFSACAQVRVMTITNEDNTIDELVTVSIIPEEIISAGYSVAELKDDILIKSQAQAQTMKDELNKKIFEDYYRVDEASKEILNSFKDGIEIIQSDWEENTYSIGVRFKNIDVYKYYYGIIENTNVEMEKEEHFFYDKLYYYANTMYVKHHNLYNKVNAYYSAQYPELVESESNELLYTYRTDLRRQHSDADFVTKQDGYYYHTWVVDPNNLDEPIMLYYNVANPENWIVVGLCITLGVTVVLLIVAVIINLIKKEPEIEIKKEDEN